MSKKIKKKNKKINIKKKKLRAKIIKWTSIIILVLGAMLLFLLSDLFNVKEIKVINNNRISSEKIVDLSGIQVNENMFKFLKFKAKESIQTEPYIENVKISRKINGIIEIKIEEREPTFMLKLEEGFLYINNQGYILEKNSEPLDIPTIEGCASEDLTPGNRLDTKDLKKLNIIIQIMQIAKIKGISELITGINAENEFDFIVKMNGEQKTIHLGNSLNLNDKITKIIPVIEDNIGVSGEIFVQDINKVYFRGDV